MPMTVITLKSVPQSLRGDLTRWMQEIATGVYAGNFNSRIREYLWNRVKETMGHGEASMCFATRNEFGYDFVTENTLRSVIDYDGLPLIFIPKEISESTGLARGFSNAAKFHRARNAVKRKGKEREKSYVIINIVTDGLDVQQNHILEIGAIRCENGEENIFHELITYSGSIPEHITNMSGITCSMLQQEGKPIELVLAALREFIGESELIGYHVGFDIECLNRDLEKCGLGYLNNRVHDLLPIIKKEQIFQEDYKLETSLKIYGIRENVPYRALEKAELVKRLAQKLNKFGI